MDGCACRGNQCTIVLIILSVWIDRFDLDRYSIRNKCLDGEERVDSFSTFAICFCVVCCLCGNIGL